MFKASAPGSMMMLGEYAVLYGKHAIVCAIDKRIHVLITPRNDRKITIQSALGNFETSLSNLEIKKPFQFVLASLNYFKKKLKTGCDISIESEFSDTVGYASSAAVTVATVKALATWLTISYSDSQLIRISRSIVRDVQGTGSGSDVAASVLGGIVIYRMKPFVAEKFSDAPQLLAIYSGHKTPTVEAIQYVEKKFSSHPKLFTQICNGIAHCVHQGMKAVQEKNWCMLGEVMNIQQGLMDALGVNNPALMNAIHELRANPKILGGKISGSGLGDCVIGIAMPNSLSSSISITNDGVRCEKI